MQLTGKLTAQEIEDAGHLARSKWYWPRLLVSNLHGFLLIGVILWATIAAAISGGHAHWRALVSIWIVMASILCWAVFSARRSRRKTMAEMNVGLPDRIEINAAGLLMQSNNGTTASRPWKTFRGWRSAGSIILLDLVESKGFIMLPMTELSSIDRANLHGILTAQLGEAKGK